MVSQLEKAMEMIITVFHSYSGKEGDKLKLTRKELQLLLQGEFGVFLSVSVRPDSLETKRTVPLYVTLPVSFPSSCHRFVVARREKNSKRRINNNPDVSAQMALSSCAHPTDTEQH